MDCLDEPCEANQYQLEQAEIILRSFRHWCGRDLTRTAGEPGSLAKQLYHAPFAVLSHDTTDDPLFNYANLCAQCLFEQNWNRLMRTPSRYSAEPVSQSERAVLLERVHTQGFIDDYQGVRISATGQRFQVRDAIIWNLLDHQRRYCGQAACLQHWQPVAAPSS